MNTEELKTRIERSKLLTSSEKEYWTEHMSELNDEQFAKLDRILSEAEEVVWTPQIEQYIEMIQRGQTATASAA